VMSTLPAKAMRDLALPRPPKGMILAPQTASCSKCPRTSRSYGLGPGCTGHRERGEIVSASRTRDHRWTVITWAEKPAGDLNTRSRIGIGRGACSTASVGVQARPLGPGSYTMPNGWNGDWHRAPGPSRQWNGGPVSRHWGLNGPSGVCVCCPGPPTYWVWGPSGGAFDYPFADWRGPSGGWGNP
jgi:hypothetical protein